MLIALWIVTAAFAVVNLLAGAGKALTPWPQLQKRMPWTETTGRGLAYLAAWSEVVGGIGAIVPLILAHTIPGWGWAAWVSLAAVVGLVVVQALAIGLHLRRKELAALPVNLVLLAIGVASAILVAVTR